MNSYSSRASSLFSAGYRHRLCIPNLRKPQHVLFFYSTQSPVASAAAIASKFQELSKAIGPQKRTQILDANQLQLFSITLNKNNVYSNSPALSLPISELNGRTSLAPTKGTPVPPGYHLIYFTPAILEDQLGIDGTDASYNPDAPFTRRMWAGGEVVWPRGPDGKSLNLLRVGQEVTETTTFLSAEPKLIRKTGEEMIVVRLEKVFENEHGVALIDRRNWVFREALKMPSKEELAQRQGQYNASQISSTSKSPPPPPAPSSPTNQIHTRNLRQTDVTLFRFSALTYNSHKIHYSLPWARDVEGHKGLVVHGPLNLISILNFWRDVRAKEGVDPELIVPERITYRATNPTYAEEEYQIVLEDDKHGGVKANIYNPDGKVNMTGDIVG
ncbi:hypothetical protein FQN57_005711 [Myotisia sp. PD_48]|nr:hypothetical protein FQN57_005711 [Myotisia sp. PD_48]